MEIEKEIKTIEKEEIQIEGPNITKEKLEFIKSRNYASVKKIEDIVRKFHDLYGCQELLMPTIQSSNIWKKSERYDDYGPEMLKFYDRNKKELLYGPTNEELITEIFRDTIRSYKDLPLMLYHIQWKFRDEVRPRFGVMRGREFLMKDAYSFDMSFEEAKAT